MKEIWRNIYEPWDLENPGPSSKGRGNFTRTRTEFLRWSPLPKGKVGLPPIYRLWNNEKFPVPLPLYLRSGTWRCESSAVVGLAKITSSLHMKRVKEVLLYRDRGWQRHKIWSSFFTSRKFFFLNSPTFFQLFLKLLNALTTLRFPESGNPDHARHRGRRKITSETWKIIIVFRCRFNDDPSWWGKFRFNMRSTKNLHRIFWTVRGITIWHDHSTNVDKNFTSLVNRILRRHQKKFSWRTRGNVKDVVRYDRFWKWTTSRQNKQ